MRSYSYSHIRELHSYKYLSSLHFPVWLGFFREVPKLERCIGKTVAVAGFWKYLLHFKLMLLTFLFNFKHLIFALNSTNNYTILKIKIVTPYWLYMRGSMYFYDYLQDYTWRSDTTSETMFSPFHVLCINTLSELQTSRPKRAPWNKKRFLFYKWGNQYSRVTCKVDNSVGNERLIEILTAVF